MPVVLCIFGVAPHIAGYHRHVLAKVLMEVLRVILDRVPLLNRFP